MFLFLFQFANQYSKYEPITFQFVAKHCSLPVSLPQSIADLVQLENIFDVMDIYLWLSYRFVEMFPQGEQIRSAQAQLDKLIQEGVAQITKLIKDETGDLCMLSLIYSYLILHYCFILSLNLIISFNALNH